MEAAPFAIGIDIGLCSLNTAVVRPDGHVLARFTVLTDAASTDWPHRVRRAIDGIEAVRGPSVVVGLSAPGAPDPDAACFDSIHPRLRQVQRLHWGHFLERANPVAVVNDGHAAMIAETWNGSAEGIDHAVLLVLAEGVSGAIKMDGKILRGQHGRAGRLGQLLHARTGGAGNVVRTLEECIGGISLEQRSDGRFRTTTDLIWAHRGGDVQATQIWLDSVEALATGIASLVSLFDPQCVVLGGPTARAGAALFEPLGLWMDQHEGQVEAERIPLVAAHHGEFASAIGAAKFAMDATRG